MPQRPRASRRVPTPATRPVPHLYEPAAVDDLLARVARLSPDSPRQWGRMTPAQAMAHCAVAMEWAVGDLRPRRRLLGLLLGRVARPFILGPEPMRPGSPTDRALVVRDPRDLAVERGRLAELVHRFADGGAAACTTHPHSFFGRLSPLEWATLMHKHIEHHLRQFGS